MTGSITIKPIHDLATHDFTALLVESERAGSRLVRRLLDDWANNTNRFDRPGEALFAAQMHERVIGVCGLNVDPYASEPRVGRVRHLYVLAVHRRQGIGRRLVAQVIAAALGVFDRLRLRTDNRQASRFYEVLGFSRGLDQPDCTHLIELRP